MGSYVVRRILSSLLVLLLLSVFAFSLIRLVPGDPVSAMATPGTDPSRLEELKHLLGLDQPIIPAYIIWLKRAFAGNLGVSFRHNVSVLSLLVAKIPVTLTIATYGLLLALLIGVPAGIVSALKQSTWVDSLIIALATIGLSIPSFWLGLMLIFGLSVSLRWFPSGGYVPITQGFLEWSRRATLPAFSIGVVQAALIARMTRSSMLEVIWKDYVKTARAKGLREYIVILKHVLRNALIPVVTTLGMIYSVLLGGAVVIERVFTIPGLGRLAMNAISGRDYTVIQGMIILTGAIYVLINFIIDMLYLVIDPTIKY